MTVILATQKAEIRRILVPETVSKKPFTEKGLME
jgi:hypothetical protein